MRFYDANKHALELGGLDIINDVLQKRMASHENNIEIDDIENELVGDENWYVEGYKPKKYSDEKPTSVVVIQTTTGKEHVSSPYTFDMCRDIAKSITVNMKNSIKIELDNFYRKNSYLGLNPESIVSVEVQDYIELEETHVVNRITSL